MPLCIPLAVGMGPLLVFVQGWLEEWCCLECACLQRLAGPLAKGGRVLMSAEVETLRVVVLPTSAEAQPS